MTKKQRRLCSDLRNPSLSRHRNYDFMKRAADTIESLTDKITALEDELENARFELIETKDWYNG